jgi:hypothetical protein
MLQNVDQSCQMWLGLLANLLLVLTLHPNTSRGLRRGSGIYNAPDAHMIPSLIHGSNFPLVLRQYQPLRVLVNYFNPLQRCNIPCKRADP